MAVTRDGAVCQAWGEQTPHAHKQGNLEGAEKNYCRAFNGEKTPWCYALTGQRWQYCTVPVCGAPPTTAAPTTPGPTTQAPKPTPSVPKCEGEPPLDVAFIADASGSIPKVAFPKVCLP